MRKMRKQQRQRTRKREGERTPRRNRRKFRNFRIDSNSEHVRTAATPSEKRFWRLEEKKKWYAISRDIKRETSYQNEWEDCSVPGVSEPKAGGYNASCAFARD